VESAKPLVSLVPSVWSRVSRVVGGVVDSFVDRIITSVLRDVARSTLCLITKTLPNTSLQRTGSVLRV
jgi:hypothetical protein